MRFFYVIAGRDFLFALTAVLSPPYHQPGVADSDIWFLRGAGHHEGAWAWRLSGAMQFLFGHMQ